MYLEIVTPEANLFKGTVESVIVPGIAGEFQMLENHAPIVSLLQEGTIKFRGDFNQSGLNEKFRKGDDNTMLLDIKSGTIELKDNKMIILVD